MTSKDGVAQLIVHEAQTRGHTRDECLAEMSALYQESEWDETAWDATHTTYGIAQQDASYIHRFEGAQAQIRAFFNKLDAWEAKPGASADIWLNICWMQQRPNWPSALFWLEHGRKAYLDEIKSRIATVTPYLDKYWPINGGTAVPALTQGDPVWLHDALDNDDEINFRALPGWDTRGHGDFKEVRGIMFHHTGNARERAESIATGRPDLAGPLSQLHIAPDGTVTQVALGVAWHAGVGSLPWLPPNMGNWYLIGVECAWPFDTSLGPTTAWKERWPDAQIKAMRNVAAAACRAGKFGVDRVTTHKEYAGRAQGKWDPGNLDPTWFRDEVAKDLSGFQFPGEGTATSTPAPVPAPRPAPDNTANVLIHRGMVGLAVGKLQLALNRNGASLDVDQDFGPATEAAVRQYQSAHPPLVADGVVGPLTAQSLGLML